MLIPLAGKCADEGTVRPRPLQSFEVRLKCSTLRGRDATAATTLPAAASIPLNARTGAALQYTACPRPRFGSRVGRPAGSPPSAKWLPTENLDPHCFEVRLKHWRKIKCQEL